MADLFDTFYAMRRERISPELQNLQIDLSRMCIHSVEAKMTADFFGRPVIAASFLVRDVASHEMKTFHASLALAPADMNLQGVRKALLMLLEHELDECLYLNGHQFTDPHPEQAAYRRQTLDRLNREMGKERDDTKTVNERVGGDRSAPPPATSSEPLYDDDEVSGEECDHPRQDDSGVWSQDD